MKKMFLLMSALISYQAYACGDYQVSAQVLLKEGDFSLVVNPGTLSQINLKVDFEESLSLSPYVGRIIGAKIHVDQMDNTLGQVSSVSGIKALISDPLLNNKGTSMTLVKKSDCKK